MDYPRPTTQARAIAGAAGARWYDFQNINRFYRLQRPGEAIGVYQADYDPATERLTEWRQMNSSGYAPSQGLPL